MRRIFMTAVLLCLLALPVQAEENQKYVALTFDDGPSGHFTTRLLDGLQKRGVHATFLLCGYRMQEFPDITRRIVSEGHEIGFHGFSHEDMGMMSRRQIAAELINSEKLLPRGCSPAFLRPPGGSVGDGVRQVAEVRLLGILTWSVYPRDWAVKDAPLVIQRVLSQVRDGDVVLMHDMSDSSVTAALEIVDQLRNRGYRLVTVSELAKLRNVKIKPGKVYQRFPASESGKNSTGT